MGPVVGFPGVGAVRADALFASGLQRCDGPGAGQVRRAVAAAIEALGWPGCAGRVAQEFGDHPETAAARMRWARAAAGAAFAGPGGGAGGLLATGAVAGGAGLMEEGMIQALVMAARLACARMTTGQLGVLRDSVERACGVAGGSGWERKAAAHAEIFGLLVDAAGDPVLAPLLRGGAGYVRELMVVVGRVADGMVVSSRRRLLAHLRDRDGEAAALEMERHLRVLVFMWCLARRTAGAMRT